MCKKEREGRTGDLSIFLQRDVFEDSGGIYAGVELRDNLRTTARELSPQGRSLKVIANIKNFINKCKELIFKDPMSILL